jgi:flagellin-like hook-associated protein FlgL
MADVTLTAAMRQNVVSLQVTQTLMDRTQERLATGRKVNSALDNPTNYFVAARHVQRANDLQGRKDQMGEAVQSIKAADTGITGMKSLLESAKGLVESARSATTADRSALGTQFSQILLKINDLVQDANYKGTNYLEAGSLTVLFNEDGSNALTVTGFTADVGVSGLGVVASGADISVGGSSLDAAASQIQVALTTLTTQASILASNLSIVSARQNFTTDLTNVLKEGADKLTLADMNEESANMLALQTRQNLGVTSLSLASQAAQSVLRLF